jgi:Zinc knuckle
MLKRTVFETLMIFGKQSESLYQHPASILYREQYSERRMDSGRKSRHSAERSFTSPHSVGRGTRTGNCRRCGKSGHWQAECTDRKASLSHLDSLHARIKEAGGGLSGIAKVLFEAGEELDVAADHHGRSDESGEDEDAAIACEEFFLTDRDDLSQAASIFRSSRVQTRD